MPRTRALDWEKSASCTNSEGLPDYGHGALITALALDETPTGRRNRRKRRGPPPPAPKRLSYLDFACSKLVDEDYGDYGDDYGDTITVTRLR